MSVRTWAALAALAVALTGCQGKTTTGTQSGSGATGSEVDAMALEQLQGLPSLEDTTTALRTAVDAIAAEADRAASGLRWEDQPGGATAGCEKPYANTPGQRSRLPQKVARNAALTVEQWAQITTAARQAAATAGAPTAQMMPAAPANRSATFIGQAGLSVAVSYTGVLTIAADTGCRLPAADK